MRRVTSLIVSSLVALALAPATSSAADNSLRGQPQMFRVDAQTVEVRFTTDKRLSDGVRVAIVDHAGVRSATAAGRHGGDYKYVARIRVRHALQTGRKYAVRFTLGDDDPVVRQVLLRVKR